jgi:hypothetical protein
MAVQSPVSVRLPQLVWRQRRKSAIKTESKILVGVTVRVKNSISRKVCQKSSFGNRVVLSFRRLELDFPKGIRNLFFFLKIGS